MELTNIQHYWFASGISILTLKNHMTMLHTYLDLTVYYRKQNICTKRHKNGLNIIEKLRNSIF